MKPKYGVLINQSNRNPMQFIGLSESQLISTMLEQGIHKVSSITHEADGSKNIRPVEGAELISIWKHVHRAIEQRKHG